GIVSSADTNFKALGVMSNTSFWTSPAPTLTAPISPVPVIPPPSPVAPSSRVYASFPGSGEVLRYNDVLVRYTWRGDCNLDGVIDGKDYYLMNYGFQYQGSPGVNGWYFGDLNGDGQVNGDDFFYIDSTYTFGTTSTGQTQGD